MLLGYRLIVHVKSEDIFADLAGDVKPRFYTSNHEVKRPLPIRKNKTDWDDQR